MNSELTLGGGVGGGILPASSWTDAINKAKSYILVVSEFTYSGTTVDVTFTIPKDKIISSDKCMYQGYYLSNSSWALYQIKYSTSAIEVKIFQTSASTTTSTETFYYDI